MPTELILSSNEFIFVIHMHTFCIYNIYIFMLYFIYYSYFLHITIIRNNNIHKHAEANLCQGPENGLIHPNTFANQNS